MQERLERGRGESDITGVTDNRARDRASESPEATGPHLAAVLASAEQAAQRILSDAREEAARLRHEAREQSARRIAKAERRAERELLDVRDLDTVRTEANAYAEVTRREADLAAEGIVETATASAERIVETALREAGRLMDAKRHKYKFLAEERKHEQHLHRLYEVIAEMTETLAEVRQEGLPQQILSPRQREVEASEEDDDRR